MKKNYILNLIILFMFLKYNKNFNIIKKFYSISFVAMGYGIFKINEQNKIILQNEKTLYNRINKNKNSNGFIEKIKNNN